MSNHTPFNELDFFAQIKARPGVYLGKKSLLSLRDQLFGMIYAFSVCGKPKALQFFRGFMEDYNRQLFLADQNGYVCWWNHLLYISGSHDDYAFDAFFRAFEAYLLKEHGLSLPEPNTPPAAKEKQP